MMDSVSPSHHEGSVSPSLPHIFSSVKQEPSDCWNPQLLHSSNEMLSENYTTYAPLEPVYPDTSYASVPHGNQYYTYANASSCIQSLHACVNTQDDSDVYIMQSTVYRDVDVSYSARDEGLGSSPSSFNSSSPPLNLPTTVPEQPPVSLSSANNFDCQRSNERSSPEDLAYDEYPCPPECGNCGSRVNVTWYTNHYLCGTCCIEETRSVVHQPDDGQNSRKRKRSSQHPNECGNCGSVVNVTWYTNHYLCGACYIEKTRNVVHQPDDGHNDRKRKRSATVNKRDNQSCTNCGTVTTTLWRRSSNGSPVCNACGLYEKLHKTNRPQSMRKDNVQTRKRKPKEPQSRQRKKSTSKAQPGSQRAQQSSNNLEQYTLPTYSSIQMRNLPLNLNPIRNTEPLLPISGSSFYPNYRPDMYSTIYHSVPPNEIINSARVLTPSSTLSPAAS